MSGWWFFIKQIILYSFLWDITLLAEIWQCLLGYDTTYWDMTLLTGILYCLLGYDVSLWDMTLLTGILYCLLAYDTSYWDMTLLSGIWHCLLGYDTSYWDMTLLTEIWHCYLGCDIHYWVLTSDNLRKDHHKSQNVQQEFQLLKMKPLCSLKILGANYSVMLHPIPEELIPHAHHCEKLKTCTEYIVHSPYHEMWCLLTVLEVSTLQWWWVLNSYNCVRMEGF